MKSIKNPAPPAAIPEVTAVREHLARVAVGLQLGDRLFLTPRDAARLLAVVGRELSAESLRKMRARREGPAFRRQGRRVAYRLDDLANFLAA